MPVLLSHNKKKYKGYLAIEEYLIGNDFIEIEFTGKISGTDEIFELDLALWEYEVLSKKELVDRGAYFKLVDGKETTHFKTCNLQNLEEVHKNSSFRTGISPTRRATDST